MQSTIMGRLIRSKYRISLFIYCQLVVTAWHGLQLPWLPEYTISTDKNSQSRKKLSYWWNCIEAWTSSSSSTSLSSQLKPYQVGVGRNEGRSGSSKYWIVIFRVQRGNCSLNIRLKNGKSIVNISERLRRNIVKRMVLWNHIISLSSSGVSDSSSCDLSACRSETDDDLWSWRKRGDSIQSR